MIKNLCVVSLAIMMTACTTMQEVKPDPAATLPDLSGRSLTVTYHQRPSFSVTTATQAYLLGVLWSYVAGRSAGNELVNQDNLKDPSRTIARRFANELEQKRGVIVNPKVVPTDAERESALMALGPDLVLDVNTEAWHIQYIPMHWMHYHVELSTQLLLLDAKNKRVLLMSTCEQSDDMSDQSPTYDELMANNGELIKQTLTRYGNACFDQLIHQDVHL